MNKMKLKITSTPPNVVIESEVDAILSKYVDLAAGRDYAMGNYHYDVTIDIPEEVKDKCLKELTKKWRVSCE